MRARDAIERDALDTLADDRDLSRLIVEVLLDIRQSLDDLVTLASEPEE